MMRNLGRAGNTTLRGWRGVAAIASCLVPIAVHAAPAQDRPPPLPTRDVAVTYKLSGDGTSDRPRKLLITYANGGERTRVDYFRWEETKTPFRTLIVDRRANRLLAVMPESRAYIEREAGNTASPGVLLGGTDMRFSRVGTATVAGLPCIDWHIQAVDKDDDKGTVCITEDGVMLRLVPAGAKEPAMTALAVTYGSPPDGLFDPPADYERRPAR